VMATSWQWRHAAAQRDAAEAALVRAEDAERLARTRLEETRRSASEMMDFADRELASLPGGAAPREAMAVSALELLGRAAESAAASGDIDTQTRHLLAYAHQRVGEARLVLGRCAQALASHERALEMWRDLATTIPDEVSYPRSLAVGHWKVAEALVAMGRLEEANRHNHDALRLLEDIAARRADSALNVAAYPGFGWRRVAETEFLAGHIDLAIDALQRAFECFDRVLAMDSGQLTTQRTRISSLRLWGDALLASGQADRAIDAYRRSLEGIQDLMPRVGNGNAYEIAASARAHASLALALVDRGEVDSARQHMAAALELADRLALADPASFDADHLQAWCRMQSAELAQRHGANDEALSRYVEAVKSLRRLADVDPDNARVRADELQCCVRLIDLAPPDQDERWRTQCAALWQHPGVRELSGSITGTHPNW
jgi:tetratricopeptide (TPR) repeat protein